MRRKGEVGVQVECVDILRELIAIPSINPRLAAQGDTLAGEQRLTQRLTGFFTEAGWPWAEQRVHDSRSNVIALVPGGRGDTLLWDAHQDTVNTEGMSIDPFAAEMRDGRIYGRGACDVKGSLAAMLAALFRVRDEAFEHRPNILLACTVNEECGFTGARALADIWRARADAREGTVLEIDGDGGLSLKDLQSARPNAAIVAEPTELNVVVAHRGVVRWQATVHGRAAHSSRPEDGANAIYAMAQVVRLIEEYHLVELGSRPSDPLCGSPTACVTTILGGTGPNTVPDRAVIDIDRRLTPSEEPELAFQELVTYLAERGELGSCRLLHERPWMQSRGLLCGENRTWAERIALVAQTAGIASTVVGVPYGTNAASIATAAIPTVVFGPGSIAQAHTADEWISLEQLDRAVDVLYQVACGAIKL
jgi:acetylornithine deacetylase